MWKTNCHIFYMYLATGLIDLIVIGPLQKKTIPTYLSCMFSPFFPFVLQIIVTKVPTYPVRTSLPCSIPSLRCRRNFPWSSADGVSHFSSSFSPMSISQMCKCDSESKNFGILFGRINSPLFLFLFVFLFLFFFLSFVEVFFF